MRRFVLPAFAWWIGLGALVANAQPPGPPPIPIVPIPPPTYTITVGTREACVIPSIACHSQAEGGSIDVLSPAPNTLSILMTGAVAANAYLGICGTANETFRLVQEFEITCSDPNVRSVVLTLDSGLVGYVRSRHHAGASMRLADASVTPCSWDNTPLVLAYPSMCSSGSEGRLCNQHLPAIVGPPMPIGRYTLVANFVLDAEASGLCDGHAVADFSPDTAVPDTWVRLRDPFQGASKKSFGFAVTVSAAPPEGPTPVAVRAAKVSNIPPTIQRVAYSAPISSPPRSRPLPPMPTPIKPSGSVGLR